MWSKIKRHSYNNNKHLYPLKERGNVHPVATTLDELTEENRVAFIELANMVWRHYPQAHVYAFGSRVKGTFTPNSDYDLVVKGITREEFARLKSYIMPAGVDLKHNDDSLKPKIQLFNNDRREKD